MRSSSISTGWRAILGLTRNSRLPTPLWSARMGADVATVVIGGKIVVENHQPRTIDVEGLYREVRAFCAKGLTPEQRARADLLRKIKPYVQAWYGTWHENMLDQPFYRVNSRT